MTIHALLTGRVTINTQSQTVTGGLRVKTWVPKYGTQQFPARIQPLKAEAITRFARNGLEVDHVIYIGGAGGRGIQAISITQGEQIVNASIGQPNQVFDVRGPTNPDYQNNFWRVHCKLKGA